MGQLDVFIRDLAVITIACAVVTLIFKRFKLPVVLGYIAAGFLISPHFAYLPTVISVDNVHAWANIGIVFLLFGIGLEFSFKKIASVGSSAVITALTVMASMMIIGTITGRSMGFGRMDSIFLGGMLSISSTMIIMKSYEEYGLKNQKFSNLVMGVMVVEDVGGIFLMVILSAVGAGKSISGMQMTLQLGEMMIYLAIWMVLGIFLIPTFLKKVGPLLNDELLLIVSLAICFAMVLISHMIGFSEALGAFMGGSILAGTIRGEKIEKLITPLKDLFGAVFFVSVGMMIEPQVLTRYFGTILIIAGITIFGQMIFSTLGILFSGRSLETAVRGGCSMVQIGEFSFIIATLGESIGATSKTLYPIIVCVAVITIILTPVFVRNGEHIYHGIDAVLPDRLKSVIGKYTTEKESSKETEDDWKRFGRRYATRTLICTGTMFVIYFGGVHVVAPAMPGLQSWWGHLLMTVLICTLLTVPASVMIHRRNHIFVKLWVKSESNRFPLTLLRAGQMIISATFYMLVIREFFRWPWWILLMISLVVVLAIVRTDFFRSQAIRIEARFITNVNEKLLHRRKQEDQDGRWMGDRMYMTEFVLTNPYDIPDVSELYDDRLFSMRVIKVIRNGTHINIPKGDQPIEPGDRIQMIGTRDELEAFLMVLERDENIETAEEPMIPMREYLFNQSFRGVRPEDQILYIAVPVDKKSPFCRKTLRYSGFRERYQGFIVGIERDNLPMVDPRIDTMILDGDILWAVGTEETAERLIRDELIDED